MGILHNVDVMRRELACWKWSLQYQFWHTQVEKWFEQYFYALQEFFVIEMSVCAFIVGQPRTDI